MSSSDVDQFIDQLPDKQRHYLQQMRDIVMSVAPEAAQMISYQIPAFKLNGKMLVYISAWKSHVSLYPIPPADGALTHRMAPYIAGKGTLRFMLDVSLPTDLIRDVTVAHRRRVEGK